MSTHPTPELDSLREEQTVSKLLRATARMLVTRLDASACTVSRVIGDLLVDLVDYSVPGPIQQLGHGYLISDYPLTREVLEQVEPRTVFTGDDEADEAEVRLLKHFGFDALLMLALPGNGSIWGLFEVYRSEPFSQSEVELAQQIMAVAAARLDELENTSE